MMQRTNDPVRDADHYYRELEEQPKGKYTATINIEVQIEFLDADEDSARNHAWDVAEEISNYVGCSRGDYTFEPEITAVDVKEESE